MSLLIVNSIWKPAKDTWDLSQKQTSDDMSSLVKPDVLSGW